MSDWWSSLTFSEQIFWGVAIFATTIQVLFFAGSLLGLGDADSDLDGDLEAPEDGSVGHHQGVGGLKLLSVRAIMGFLTGFGWAGVLGLGSGMTLALTLILACVTGLVFALLVALTLKFVMSMTADGTLRYERAVGTRGKVYVTIPARRGGHGQIEILLQGRLITAPAVTDADHDLPQLAAVEVTAMESAGVFMVRPV